MTLVNSKSIIRQMELKSKLEKEFLPFVIKPGQYIGNEFGAVRLASSRRFKVALAVPRNYDQSATGWEVQSIYHYLNSLPEVGCERVFLPGVEAQRLLKAKEIPLFSLESFRPVKQFDVLIFQTYSPLEFPYILQMLHLAGLPLRSAERKTGPVILGTGNGFVNPAPMAEYLDGFILEWQPETIEQVLKVLQSLTGGKNSLAEIEGIYVPGFNYKRPKTAAVCEIFPVQPVVPFIELNRDELFVQGDNQSWPGPAWKCSESTENTAENFTQAIQNSGFERIRIDCEKIGAETKKVLLSLEKRIKDRRFAFEIDSISYAEFDSVLADLLAATNRQQVSFKAVASSQRLSSWTGQEASDELIQQVIKLAIEREFQLVTARFVLGIPKETDEDLKELAGLITNLNAFYNQRHRCKHLQIEVSFFAPWPGSAWQWDDAPSVEEMQRKTAFLKDSCRTKSLKWSWPDFQKLYWENLLHRGDRSLGQIIFKAYQELNQNLSAKEIVLDWQSIFKQAGLEPANYCRAFKFDEELPWDFLFTPEEKEPLRKARTSGAVWSERKTDIQPTAKPHAAPPVTEQLYGRRAKIKPSVSTLSPSQSKIRMKWVKAEKVRFTSHLDTVRMFEKAVRRADFPVVFSEGFHPHPKIAYGPPLPLGFISDCEYVDMQIEAAFNYQLIDKLNSTLPEGFRIVEARPVFAHSVSLSAFINAAVYEMEFEEILDRQVEALKNLSKAKEVIITRKFKEGSKTVNIAGLIYSMKIKSQNDKKIVRTCLGLGQEGYVRPQEVLQSVFNFSEQELAGMLFKRIDLLAKKGESYLSPMQVL